MSEPRRRMATWQHVGRMRCSRASSAGSTKSIQRTLGLDEENSYRRRLEALWLFATLLNNCPSACKLCPVPRIRGPAPHDQRRRVPERKVELGCCPVARTIPLSDPPSPLRSCSATGQYTKRLREANILTTSAPSTMQVAELITWNYILTRLGVDMLDMKRE